MREPSSTAPDRRQAPRTKLVEIAYIGMGPENGGLVLDVSDGGLSFHSVAPVQPAQKIEFLLSLRGHSRIEGAGEVVWTNNMKTVCGLKFTSLSSGAREHLNNWTNQSKMPVAAREKMPALTPVMRVEPADQPQRPLGETAEPVFAIPPTFNSPLSEPASASLWSEPLFLWILFLLMGSALGVGAYRYGVQEGRTEVSALSRVLAGTTGQTNPQANSSEPAPIPPAENETHAVADGAASLPANSAPFPGGTLVNASKTDDASGSAAQSASPDDSSAAAQRTEQQLQAGQSELAAAQSYLATSGINRDTVKAARLLWAAVGNGNTTAELLLADLYIRGDGVAKSCEQGRILLVAAVKSGNIEAPGKLKELNATGCQ